MKTTDRILYLCEDKKKIIYVDKLEPAPEKYQGNFYPFDYYSETLFRKKEKSFDVLGQEMAHAKVIFKTLKGAPKEVSGDFVCDSEIQSFEGGPEKVGGSFEVNYYAKLKSLKYGPKEVKGNVELLDAHLKSLEGGPEKVGGSFIVDSDKLTSLEGGPKEVGGEFDCSNCPKLSEKEVIRYSEENPKIKIRFKNFIFKDGVKTMTIKSPHFSEDNVIKVSKRWPDAIVKSKYGEFKNGKKL